MKMRHVDDDQRQECGTGPCVDLLGIPIQAESLEQALDRIDFAISSRQRLHIGVVNASKIVNMWRNPELSAAVLGSDVIYADGMSVVWASRILGDPLPGRVTGIDLMQGILEHGQIRGYRVFCLGAEQKVLDKVCKEFAAKYPGIIIAGARSGYFTEFEEKQVADEIRDAKADVLLVAITSPKKEKFMARWGEHCNVPVVHGVGGSFDIVAGLVERAPLAWQRSGMEWLYRVLQEPGRLWKRYLVTNTVFIYLIISEMFTRTGRKVFRTGE